MSLFEVVPPVDAAAAAAATASGETTFMGDGDVDDDAGEPPTMIFDVTVFVILCWLLWKWQELMVC